MLASVPRDFRSPGLSNIISALSFALDLTEGQPLGHAVRTCVIGTHVGNKLGLSPQENADLYYALLLKDSGCSNNAARISQILGSDDRHAKREMRSMDWSRMSRESFAYFGRNVMPERSLFYRAAAVMKMLIQRKKQTAELFSLKCERGAGIARQLGFSEQTAAAIYSMDEHWDCSGYPHGLKRDRIPVISRIINLAQTLDLFVSIHGVPIAFEVVRRRSGSWFDPELIRILSELETDGAFWERLKGDGWARELAIELEPPQYLVPAPINVAGAHSNGNRCSQMKQLWPAHSFLTAAHRKKGSRCYLEGSGRRSCRGICLMAVTGCSRTSIGVCWKTRVCRGA